MNGGRRSSDPANQEHEVRQEMVIREQEKMIRALTDELMNAQQRTRDYILKRMGHCNDCEIVSWHDDGPSEGDEPPCDCAYRTVEGLFAEIEEKQR